MTMTLFYFIFSCLYHQTLTDLTNVASMWLIYLVFVSCFFVLLFLVLCLVPNVDSPFWFFSNVYYLINIEFVILVLKMDISYENKRGNTIGKIVSPLAYLCE
jgi:hypothetical protein